MRLNDKLCIFDLEATGNVKVRKHSDQIDKWTFYNT